MSLFIRLDIETLFIAPSSQPDFDKCLFINLSLAIWLKESYVLFKV